MDTGGKDICANADCGEETDCAGEKDVDLKSQLRKSNALYISKIEYTTCRRDGDHTAWQLNKPRDRKSSAWTD